MPWKACLALCCLALRAGPAFAAQAVPPAEPPDVLTREGDHARTIRAVRLTEPLKLDGRLDDAIYSAVPGTGNFIMMEPHEGEPASEQTDVWVFFDNTTLYVVGRCWDSEPNRWIGNELQRDSNNINQNENLTVALDTFRDRRNGFFFQTSVLGAMRDQTFTDERVYNQNWNGIWDVRSARFEGGWSFEMAIPFKTLRYGSSGPQEWGINFRRVVPWKNEISMLTHVPASYGMAGVIRMSIAATLVGLETPAQSMNLELKPYAISSLTTDLGAAVPFSNHISPNAGFDFKYGVTRGLIADATYNTDFAQVEEDVQQVNLTRFSLMFPEKRDFFLEGQGVFGFAGTGGTNGNGGSSTSDVPIPFFSRRIGSSLGQAVPVLAGGRLTGTVGGFGVGLLNVQTEDKPEAAALATNFSVVRVKHDVLRRSNVGLIATRRSPSIGTAGSNGLVGMDLNMAFFSNITATTYYTRTDTPGLNGGDASYQGKFDYSADRYGLQLDHLAVGDRFNPEIGFTRRRDFRRSSIGARFSPRPASSRLVRKYNWNAGYDYITDSRTTRIENRQASGSFGIDFNRGDSLNADYTHDYEFLPRDFEISPGVVIPIGSYDYDTARFSYTFGQQRPVSGQLRFTTGTFYDGTKKEVSISNGRLVFSSHASIEPGVTLNWVDLPEGAFQTRLITVRAVVTLSPRALVSSLSQFNGRDHSLSTSARLHWEYKPGSDLFIVYSDGRSTAVGGIPALMSRSLAIKITRLFRF